MSVNNRKVKTAKQYIQEGKIQPGIDLLLTLTNEDLEKNAAYGILASALHMTKKWEEAIPHFERALVHEPEKAALWRYYKAEALAFVGRYRECIEEIEKLMKTHQVVPGVIWLKLLAAQAAGLDQEVLISLGELAAISTDPDREEAHQKAALSCTKLYQETFTKLDEDSKINGARKIIEAMKTQ